MNLLSWFDESFSLRLIQALLHFLWQGSLIAAMTVASDRLLRHASARVKYAFHVVALLAMIPCLLVTFAMLEVPNAELAASNRWSDTGSSVPSSQSPAFPMEESSQLISRVPNSNIDAAEINADPLSDDSALEPAANLRSATNNAQASQSKSFVPLNSFAALRNSISAPRVVRFAPYIAAVYLFGVLGMTVRLLWAFWGGHQLRRAATPITDRTLLAMVERQSRRIGLRIAPAVAYCKEISVPIVMGILNPLILLPTTAGTSLSANQLQALLAHELAHLRRLDPLVNLLQRLIEAVLFFHPAVWYISHRIHTERENASDDLVLAAGFPRLTYADALVRMAELSATLRDGRFARRPAAIAASGNSSSEFKRRVLRLLGRDYSDFRPMGWGWLSLLLVMAVAASSLLFASAWAAPSSAPDETSTRAENLAKHVGRKIDNFSLNDYLGNEFQLNDFSKSRLVVVAFLGVDCPLAKVYGARLIELSEKYKTHGVAFLGINSNQQDTPTEIGHYVRRHEIKFPLLKDPGNKIADQFGGERTPEVFVLDEQRVVRYWGTIDDQFGVGYSRPAPTRQFLVTAIDELLAGKPVSHPESPSVGCHIGRVVRKTPTGAVTYSNQVARILQRRCVECHRDGGIAPFKMDSYAEVAGWAETIREVVAEQRMPPWHADPRFGHFSNDNRMPDEEKQILDQWVKNGMPEGNAADLPSPPSFVEGWSLGRPDLVIKMSEPFTVSADGVVPYQYFTVDPGFKEGKWVRASEVMPGVRSVVHHVIVFINPPGGDPILEERGVGFEMVGAYVPGTPPMQLSDGVARYVPPGSTFVFQMHYTPDGTVQKDQTEIGLYFADPSTVRRTMQTGVAVNLDFVIPPNATEHRVEAHHRFDHDMEVHALTPHMHYRGKSFRFEVIYPNGSREILLDVPRFDFNWQNTYRLAKPKLVPEGSLLRCIASFDNSEHNLSNPDPSIPVKWGEQTWEEMMIGYFEGVFLNQDLALSEPQITPLGNDEYRVRFAYRPDRRVRSVNLAGTFNEWNTSSHPLKDLDQDGVFEADVQLKQGPHRYKFVVDGNYWTHDPASRILTGIFHESFFVAGRDVKPAPASQP